jgi:hypothetical protein
MVYAELQGLLRVWRRRGPAGGRLNLGKSFGPFPFEHKGNNSSNFELDVRIVQGPGKRCDVKHKCSDGEIEIVRSGKAHSSELLWNIHRIHEKRDGKIIMLASSLRKRYIGLQMQDIMVHNYDPYGDDPNASASCQSNCLDGRDYAAWCSCNAYQL